MDSMVLQLAKSLVQFDTAELNSVFTSVENPALVMLSKHLSIPELSNYIGNYTITFTSIAQSETVGIIRVTVSRIAGLKVGSIVTIDSSVEGSVYNKKYVVQAIDEENKTIDLNGELNQKGDNLWGLFSGVTKYTTHSMKKGDNTEGKIFGQVGYKERQIWDNLVELV
jgi:hypothetical protein